MSSDIENTPKAPAPTMESNSTPHVPARKPNGQYQTGTTGNPRGRPKKQERARTGRQLTKYVLDEAERLVPVTVDGKTEMISMYVLLIRQMFNRALKEGPKQIEKALERIERAQSHHEADYRWFFEELKKAEAIVNLPPLALLETKTPETIAEWRKWSRKIG